MTPYLLATWVMALATPECSAPIRMRAVLPGDEALGDAGAGGRRGFGVGRDPRDLAAEHAALGVDLVDRHPDAAQIVLAAVAVLAAGIAGEAELDRLGALRPDPVLLPGAEETAGAADDAGHQAALQTRPDVRSHASSSLPLQLFVCLVSCCGHRMNILLSPVKWNI